MKPIPSTDYVVRPFHTHKHQTYQYTFLSGSNPEQVKVDVADAESVSFLQDFNPTTDGLNPSGIYKRPLYASLQNMFYRSGSIYNRGNLFHLTGSQTYVVNIAQQAYGEEIAPGSFRLTSPLSTGSLYDTGDGHIVSTTQTGSIIGNVFYGLGIVVLQKATGSFTSSIVSHAGLYLDTGSSVIIEFGASHTIYEHEVLCTMDPGEFNYSVHPSITAASSSVSGSVKILDAFASGTLTPYMTTIGLFTNRGELVAVAKFPQPIKRASESQQTVVIRFDV